MSRSARDWAFEQWGALGKQLSPGAKLVLYALGDRADRRTRQCIPGKRDLAELTGLTSRAVTEALKQLVALRLITRRPRFHDGKRTSDLYTLLIPPEWIARWEEDNLGGVDSSPLRLRRGAVFSRTGADTSPEPFRNGQGAVPSPSSLDRAMEPFTK
jgi:DNA-binding transcriptional MocR family regulator